MLLAQVSRFQVAHVARVVAAILLSSSCVWAQKNGEAASGDWEVWRIFVPAEDVGKLVPLDYNLIEVDELAAALKREAELRSESTSLEPHIAESIYVVRASADNLISDQSRWMVRSESAATKLKLDALSVALRNSGVTPTEDKQLLSSLRYSVDGQATVANVAGDSNYWFGFSASPTSIQGKQAAYELSLPPATMAKFLVSVPENMSISSPDVIVSAVDDPRVYLPESWPSLAAYEGHRWYLIYLSGKSQFRLLTETLERKDSLTYRQFVRRAALAYIASNKSVTLSADFEVERMSAVEPLRLSLDAALKIRSLAANDKAVEYRIVESSEAGKHTIELPNVNSSGRTRVRVEATSDVEYPLERSLPWIEVNRAFAWEGRTTVTAEDDLQVEEIAIVGRADLPKAKLESTTIGRRWSADWVGSVPVIAAKINRPENRWSASTLTRLTIQQDWIAATTNLKLNCSGLRSNELRLRIGKGWFIDDVTVEPSENRVSIQLPDGEAQDAILTWDRLQDEMSINLQIVAHLPRETDVEQFNLSAPRVATVVGGDQFDLYAIEQTGRLRIQPDPLLLRLQVRGADIAPWQMQLLTQLNASQLYRGFDEHLPPLSLHRASGTYAANVKSIVRSLNGQLQMTHTVEVEPTAGPIDFASCLLSVPANVTMPVWRVLQEVDGEQMELTKATVTANRNEADARGETRFDFQLAESTATRFVLQCELLVPFDGVGPANLPLVTTSVATDTWLIVPRHFALPQSIAGLVALPSSICCEAGALAENLGEDANSMAAYRYDPTLVSSVELRPASRVAHGGAWVWSTATDHWLYSDGRVTHQSQWEVFAPENMTFLIDLPTGWVVNRVTVDGVAVTVNQPLDSSQLPIAIPKGERVNLLVQSLSLVNEPSWYGAFELPKPSCAIPSLESSEWLWLQPGRLAFSELSQRGPRSMSERLLPVNWWRWLSPAVRVEANESDERLADGVWRRIAIAANVPASSKAPMQFVGASSGVTGSSAGLVDPAGDVATAPTMVARVQTIDRSSLCAICIAVLLAGAGWCYVVLGNRPVLWWMALTAAVAVELMVSVPYVMFAQVALLCLVCGGLARLVRIVTTTRYSRSGQNSRRGSTVVRSSAVASSCLLLACCATRGDAQEMRARTEKSPTVYGVLIPLNEDGELSAKHVFVPNKLMNLLDRSKTADAEDLSPQILNAKYMLKLRSDTSLTTSYVQEFSVDFDVLFNSTDFALRLPFLKSQLQLLRGSVSGQEIYIGQRLVQTADEIAFRPAEVGRVRLRLQMIPAATEANGRSAIDVAIPRIASSTLEVLAGDAMDVEVKALGAVRRLTTSSWTAELGPSDTLRVNWPTRTQRLPSSSQTQTQSDTWLHLHEGNVVADCQLRVSGATALPKQVHVIVDAAWEPVGSQWQDARLVSSELSAVGSRRIYTVDRDAFDERMVIRALMVPRNTETSGSLSIPFFALQENLSVSRTLALSSVGRARWRLVGNEFWSRLTSSATEMGWDSSKPAIADAWRVPTGSLNGTLQRIAVPPKPIVDEKCELQLLSTATQLNYRADWSQASDEQVVKFELPKVAKVESVLVNGAAAEYQLSQAGERRYLLVRVARNAVEIRSIQIQLSSERLKSDAALPRILLQDVAVSASQYQVSCGSELICKLRDVESDDLQQRLNFSLPVQDSTLMLSTLTAPVGVAELGNRFRDSVYLPGSIEIKNRKPVKLVANVMALSRSEMGWRATVEALLESDDGVSFVFFDVPSTIRDLIESTGSPFRVSAAGGAGRSTLCLLPRLGDDGKSRVSFTFRLSALGSSQSLAIPDVAFMGARGARPVLALPKTIDEQPVQWSRAGRRLGADWLAKSGVALKSDDFVCFELSDVQQQTSWRPAQLDGKPAEVLFQWATIDQDAQGNVTGVINYWIDPNNHLDVAAVIPASAELIGVQSGSSGAVWHRDDKQKVRILMQPSYLPVHVRLLLKWKGTRELSTTQRAFELEMPTLEAAGTKRMAIAVDGEAVLRGLRGEQVDAPESRAALEIEADQFEEMLAERWSKLLLKALPVVSDLSGEELSSWIRNWSPSVATLARTQVIPASADANGTETDVERETVGEFWDWYVDQLSDFEFEGMSALPLSAEMQAISSKLGLKPSEVVQTVAALASDAKWYVLDLPADDELAMLVLVEPLDEQQSWSMALPLIGLLVGSAGLWLAMLRLRGRAAELVAQQPWLYWVLLSVLCWILLPSVLPSIVIGLCALGMTISQLATSRRRQLALRR